MMMKSLFSLVVMLGAFIQNPSQGRFDNRSITKVDICIYGGTSAGVIAAYTAKKKWARRCC